MSKTSEAVVFSARGQQQRKSAQQQPLEDESYAFPRSEDDRSVGNMRKQWFRSVSILPGDQPAVVQENQSISRLQP